MSRQAKRPPPALKHGAYSEAVLLPGEDPAEFEKLHSGLIAQFAPQGRMEEETVASLARLMWRRQNLARFEISQLASFIAEGLEKALLKARQAEKNNKSRVARRRYTHNQEHEDNTYPYTKEEDEELIAELEKLVSANRRAHKAQGTSKEQKAAQELCEVAKAATLYRLMKELDVEERLDAMIDRLLKRLLFLRGIKSITSSAAITSQVAARTRLHRRPTVDRDPAIDDSVSQH
jgi:hypothetical protein